MDLVLKKLRELGGVRTTNAPAPAPFVLPVRSWQGYHEPTLESVSRPAVFYFARAIVVPDMIGVAVLLVIAAI